jgi:acetylornithine deacetylase
MSLDRIGILERLVGFPTVSRDTNLPLIDWVRNFLGDFGIDSHLVRDESGAKANLFATIGPLEPDGLVLSGHTDVVPVDGQAWSSDPFTLTARGSRLYGRGSCDMKGFMAAALAHVPSWKQSGLRRPVHLMFSYDEELGCRGVPSMIAAAREMLPQPAAVIVGEPTGMRLAVEHKGACALRTEVTGIEAHSSLTHRGVSAVMLAAELIAHLGGIGRELASREPAACSRFEPPYTTLSVNRIAGGTAVNVLARSCEFSWEVRPIPGQTSRFVLDRLAAYADQRLAELLEEGRKCGVATHVLADAPPLEAEENGVAAQLVKAVAGTVSEAIAISFGTEAGCFQQAGWSSVVCGPGSIEQAHRPDEFVELAQLAECEKFLGRAVRRQCG